MDKETLAKRIEILDKIELLKEKCDCNGYNPNCKNCKEIAKFGSKLNKLVSKARKTENNKAGRKKETYPDTLTLEEYKYLRSLKLSDENIARVFETTAHFVRRFKEDHKIRTKKRQVKRNMSAEEKAKLKQLIIRERLRIKNKAN